MTIFGLQIKKAPPKEGLTEKKITEFSKRVVVAMVVLWFMTAVVGMYIVLAKDLSQLPTLTDFVKDPVSVVIIGYMAKIAFENPAKIKYVSQKGEEHP